MREHVRSGRDARRCVAIFRSRSSTVRTWQHVPAGAQQDLVIITRSHEGRKKGFAPARTSNDIERERRCDVQRMAALKRDELFEMMMLPPASVRRRECRPRDVVARRKTEEDAPR